MRCNLKLQSPNLRLGFLRGRTRDSGHTHRLTGNRFLRLPHDDAEFSAQRDAVRGIGLIDLLIGVAVVGIMAAILLPQTKSALKSYHLDTAVQSVSGTIQSARYQAIMAGYHYRIALNSANTNYQLSSMVPPATSFSNVGQAVPWSTSGDVTISPATTLEFYPGGKVSATTGSLTFSLTNGTSTKTITVSTVGNVSVAP
jgi:Tfp pilus assembly protein FimT